MKSSTVAHNNKKAVLSFRIGSNFIVAPPVPVRLPPPPPKILCSYTEFKLSCWLRNINKISKKRLLKIVYGQDKSLHIGSQPIFSYILLKTILCQLQHTTFFKYCQKNSYHRLVKSFVNLLAVSFHAVSSIPNLSMFCQ